MQPRIPKVFEARQSARAITLIEMLVVIIIIGILAGLALPHIRGHSESVVIDAAVSQLVRDLSYARQKAISQRGIVAVVFVTDAVFDPLEVPLGNVDPADPAELKEIQRLQAGAFTHYAIYQFRRAGEQPGRATHGYLTEWKSLPEKTFFPTNNNFSVLNLPRGQASVRFPFPFDRSGENDHPPAPIHPHFPYIAFDSEGRSIRAKAPFGDFRNVEPTGDITISIARGAVFYARDSQGQLLGGASGLELQEIPRGNGANNLVQIDYATGRAKRLQAEVQ